MLTRLREDPHDPPRHRQRCRLRLHAATMGRPRVGD